MKTHGSKRFLIAGLLAPAAFTSPKYLYDALGSRLFEAITELPEYDLTRTEALLMRLHSADMAQHLPAGACWVDLGAGNCEKAGRLLGPRQAARYVAVDISVDFVRQALDSLQRHFFQLGREVDEVRCAEALAVECRRFRGERLGCAGVFSRHVALRH